jgi:hypothetical protein
MILGYFLILKKKIVLLFAKEIKNEVMKIKFGKIIALFFKKKLC